MFWATWLAKMECGYLAWLILLPAKTNIFFIYLFILYMLNVCSFLRYQNVKLSKKQRKYFRNGRRYHS